MIARTIIAVATALTVTAIGPLGAGQIRAGADAAAVPLCTHSQLVVSPLKSSGAAGSVAEMYKVHNQLPGSCSLIGYPGAMLLDRNFNSLPTTVTRGMAFLTGHPKPVQVTLSGSRNAYFALKWTHIPAPGQACPAARYVMITLPNDRLPVVSYAGNHGAGIDACGGKLTATPVAGSAFSI